MSQVLDSKTVKTRKDHNCWGCAKLFPKGSKLLSVTAICDGAIGTAYWCDDCIRVPIPKDLREDQYSYGELKQIVEEYQLENNSTYNQKCDPTPRGE